MVVSNRGENPNGSQRDLGIIHKLFVSRRPGAALVLGTALSAGVRSLSCCAP